MKKNKPSDFTFDANKMLLSKNSPFSMQEAFKTLRTNVAFSLPGNGCKCIGIVSASRSDGKSSIAINLSISLAQINKKVILLDCDMRMPTIASKLKIKSTPGMSNYLSGNCDEVPIIHDDTRGIDIIPSGNIPPDSTALINSDQMVDLIRQLKGTYDYIVFDFPPINIVSDAVMLSNVIDGYLLVVRHELSEYQMVTETMRQMRFANAKVIGAVYNGKGEGRKYYKKSKYYKNYKSYKYYKSYENYQ